MKLSEPKIRFPYFRKNWEEVKIKHIIQRYVKPVKVELTKDYKQIGIRSHCKGIFHKELVSGIVLGNKRVFWIIENALIINIVFAWEQAVSITTKNEIGLIASHRFPMYLPFDNKSDVNFLNYFFTSQKGKFLLESASPGGAGRNKTLGQKEFDNSKLIIPSIEEQTKIANFLSAVDEKLNLLKEKKSLLKDYKKSIMQQIFNQELRFKDDNGNAFEDWAESTIADICVKIQSGGTPKSSNKDYYDGDIPFLSISDMTKQGKYIEYTSNSISEMGLKNSSSWLVPANSIIYSMYASVGFAAINKIPLATSQAVLNLILKENIFTDFVYYFLQYFQKHLAEYITTGTQGNLNAQTVKGFNIPIPCLKEQTKIANFLSSIDEKIELIATQIEDTQEYKKGLLQQMFI
ncbi:hypothetical protein B0A67_06120 [Flavobacterium aquidurense]|uniref:restriction endonuclease subunit S n=1 Tax=Flavobacterium aquidurense TaxID=362413 RepID=UPI000920F99C|nr:restriction endonuclease subunit S [Flavobacterium aquidurense]OXA73016.1 hypothetical protein B0A67_06120 [Flavobacterium aquidurense]SHH16931.1 type I restriction enzyme, S subunit [Flavobacterium frigidimaris]